MTEANELKIGNWVKYDGELYKVIGIVTSINSNGTRYFRTQLETREGDFSKAKTQEWINPIPLTPEILEKCGWTYNNESDLFEIYGDARMSMVFRENVQSYVMFNSILKALIAKRITYIHQLQNLFFALTGEELTVNL